MTMRLVFDVSLAVLTLAMAGWTIGTRSARAAAIGFVVYGFLLGLASVRLATLDVALTEASIGALSGLLLLAAGVIGFSLAIAMGLAWAYRNIDFPAPVTDLVQTLTLQFIPHPYREIVIGIPGIALMVYAVVQLSRSIQRMPSEPRTLPRKSLKYL